MDTAPTIFLWELCCVKIKKEVFQMSKNKPAFMCGKKQMERGGAA
jgi:hypothetical protein